MIDFASVAANNTLVKITQIKGPKEATLFIDLIRELDDGEAATCAVAIARGIPVATDDRKALRVITERTSTTPWETPALLKLSFESRGIGLEYQRRILLRVERCVHFRPRRDHQLREWWVNTTGNG